MRRNDISLTGKPPQKASNQIPPHQPHPGNPASQPAYDAWKLGFDSYASLPNSSSGGIKTEAAARSTLALYHAAHLILHTDIRSLQIYAGARSILGKPVSPTDYDRSCAVIESWSATPAARKSAYHAAAMICGSFQLESGDDGRFYYPWRLYRYLAALVCWAGHGNAKEEIVWDAKGEMRGFLEDIFKRGRDGREGGGSGGDNNNSNNSNSNGSSGGVASSSSEKGGNPAGLIPVIAKYLNAIRWALVQEGCRVLGGLIAGRLLKENEAVI